MSYLRKRVEAVDSHEVVAEHNGQPLSINNVLVLSDHKSTSFLRSFYLCESELLSMHLEHSLLILRRICRICWIDHFNSKYFIWHFTLNQFQLLKIYLIQLFITPVPMEPRHLIYHPVLSILNMKPEFKKMQNLQCFIAQSSCLSRCDNEIHFVFSNEECPSCERSRV